MEVSFTNNGGTQQVWTLSELPAWLTASKEEGAAEALTTTTIGFDIPQSVAIGTYEGTVYLTGNEDISSALTINLKVTGDVPQWSVNAADYENSINLVGTLSYLGQPTNDAEDLVAAFIDGECRGVAHPVYNARYDNYFVMMDIYGNKADAGKGVIFYAYDSSTGTKYPELSTSQEITFRDNQVYGTFASPIILNAEDLIEQTRNLVQGWNWISFYVRANELAVEKIFNPIAASADVVKSQSDFAMFENGSFYGTSFDTDNSSMYKVHMTAPQVLNTVGRRLTAEERAITLKPGWNWVAYNAMQTASVIDALAPMNPQDGDVIKAQQGFAMYDGYEWNGSLKSLTPGQGYMIQSAAASDRSFEYPTQTANSSLSIEGLTPQLMSEQPLEYSTSTFNPIDYHIFPGNMCIVACVTWEGTPLVGCEVGVFDEENCRVAKITDHEGYAYFAVPGDESMPLNFRLVYDGEIYTSDITVSYEEDAIIGTHSNPLIVSFDKNGLDNIFVNAEDCDIQWYTVSGISLPCKPTELGVYICRKYDKRTQTVTTRKVFISK